MIDMLAERLGIDRLELRRMKRLHGGQPHQHRAKS